MRLPLTVFHKHSDSSKCRIQEDLLGMYQTSWVINQVIMNKRSPADTGFSLESVKSYVRLKVR